MKLFRQVSRLPLLEKTTGILDEEVVNVAVIVVDLADVRYRLGGLICLLLPNVVHEL